MTVLLVEDEMLVRIGLRNIFESYDSAISIIEAKNGKEALEKFYKFQPEVVFADIDMPIMNGLDFIREARKANTQTKFVILSCYNNFVYMREAIQLGVSDYIMKTDMEESEVIKILSDIDRVQSPAADAKALKSETYGAVMRDALYSLIQGNASQLTSLQHYFAAKHITDPFVLMLLSETQIMQELDRGVLQHTLNVVPLLHEIMDDYGNGIILQYGKGVHAVIFSLYNKGSQSDSLRQIREFCSRALQSLKNYYNREYTIGVFTDASLTEIQPAVKKATKAQNYGFFDKTPQCHIFGEEEIPPSSVSFEKQISRIKDALNISDYKSAIDLLSAISENAQTLKSESIDSVLSGLCEVFFAIKNHIDRKYQDTGESSGQYEMDFLNILSKCNLHKIIDSLTQILEQLVYHTENANSQNYYADIIFRAKCYIEAHFRDNISLKDVAQHVNLSSSHFSKVFKESTGENFIDYCIRIKIDKAKEYLNQGEKAHVAASNVGYYNYSYFSRLFKKIVGVSPEAYRNE